MALDTAGTSPDRARPAGAGGVSNDGQFKPTTESPATRATLLAGLALVTLVLKSFLEFRYGDEIAASTKH